MSNDEFNGQILAEKLSKLNNSQQSIESLSRWCVTHRKKAKQIVETWDKLFNSSQREQRVSFLYLANDILQNSRRKGSEFVNEFWKVLPAALKLVYENGDEHGKKVVTRLVDIWEERKVFGSRGRSLKDEMLAKNPPPLSVSNGKSSNLIKIVKRDANSVRIKLAVGGLPEKILTAFQSVLDEHSTEEATLSKCSASVRHVGKIEEDVESNLIQGNQQRASVVDKLQEQENILQQCVGQLESAEATRTALISQLKEAVQDQESMLEYIHSQLQVARGQIEQASNVRKRLASPPIPSTLTSTMNATTEATRVVEHNLPQPVVPFVPLRNSEDENKKAAAAAVAAKLAASASSAQMLTSVLSSLVAEEAASMNGSIISTGFSSGLPMFSPEKRPKLEKPLPVSDVSSSDVSSTTYFTPLQQQSLTNVPPSTSMQTISQANQMQGPFTALPPPPPPPPPLSPATPPTSQYVQSAGIVVMPYGYGANALPPPPPLPPHVSMSMARPGPQPSGQQQQQSATGGYYRPPPGIGFYGQGHPPTTPPVHRQ